MDALITEVNQVASTADEAGRKKILDTLRDLQYSIEKPEDTMQRVIHLHLVLSTIHVAVDLKLFNILVESKDPLILEELSARTSTDPVLLGRILRLLSSLGIIKETSKDEFAANNITRNLSIPEIQAGIYHNYDVFGPVYQKMPFYLKENGYQNVTSLTDGVFQAAWQTDLPMWTWLHQHPEATAHFNLFMKAQRSSTPNCFNFYPVEEECQGWPADKPVFVDVGGGSGHQCIALKKKFPNLAGQIVLQDLARPIEEAKAQIPSSVQAMVHDFFTPQPVKGAKYYYLRAIMHDHADDECVKILENIKPAMTEESVILLDEMVLPNSGVDWFATQTDLTMMIAFGSMERTEDQWTKLLSSVGLKIKKIYTYTHSFRLSVIAVTL